MAVARPIIVVAIGSRDLDVAHEDAETMRALLREEWVSTGKGSNPPDFTRRVAELVLEDYDKLKATIRLPILEPLLARARQQYDTGASAILYLVATDQPAEVGWHHENDTIGAARVIARWLSEPAQAERFAVGTVRGAVEAEDAGDFMLSAVHPADYRAQYRHWDGVFARLSERHRPEAHHLFVGVTGGTPQINTALMLRGIKHFRGVCSILYVPQGGAAAEVAIGRDIWREQVGDDFRAALDDGRYQTATSLVEQFAFCFIASAVTRSALHLLAARAEFDFARARQAIGPTVIASAPPDLAAELRRQQQELNVLVGQDPTAARETARLIELFHNAVLQFQIGHYADFLGRYIALLDSLLAFLVAQVTGDWTTVDSEGLKHWLQKVQDRLPEGVRQAAASLAALRPRDSSLHGRCFDEVLAAPGSPYRPLSEQLRVRSYVAVGLPPGAPHRWPDRDHEPNWQNEDLNRLRNESVIAHGFVGVSRQSIEDRYRQPYYETAGAEPVVLADLRQALSSVGVSVGDSPYARLVGLLRQPGVAIAAE